MQPAFEDLPDDPDAFGTEPLPLDPAAKHGVLENGMKFYVRHAPRPKGRVAIALAVDVGSLAEEDSEQGVAHIVEHLAFSATEGYSNHELVRFLESIGAEFGACQNAHTTCDETVYELQMPVEKLNEGLSVLAEFATKIRCHEEDLVKERGPVMDEFRSTRSADGRAMEKDWEIMMQGCKYENRRPIGLERVIRGVKASAVRAFFERWYHPGLMAVIVSGDFKDSDAVVGQIRHNLESCHPHNPGPPPPVPRAIPEPFNTPRIHTWVDREQQGGSIQVLHQMPAPPLHSATDLRGLMSETAFQAALNARLFRISRRLDPPFFAASVSGGPLTRTINSYGVVATVQDGGHERALETVLTELARVRLHGFSEREVAAALEEQMADAACSYCERDQVYGEELRDEYVRHFFTGELVVGREKEARLAKTLLPRITPDEVAAVATRYRSSCSCVIRASSHRRAIREQRIQEVVAAVEALERHGAIEPWDDAAGILDILPEDELPPKGTISSRRELAHVGACELTLGNGMKVCYKCTEFMGDQVLVNAFATGGLSNVPRDCFKACNLASRLASELGQFGHPPEALADALMGRRIELNLAVAAYSRAFGGEQSPRDLETALQLVYRLFTHRVTANAEQLETILRFLKEAVAHELRDPMREFHDRVRLINHSGNYFYERTTAKDLESLDAAAACEFFDACFRNPAEFTVCVVGSLEEESFEELVEQYLAAIPATDVPPVLSPSDVVSLPSDFPLHVVDESVRTVMAEPQGVALITIPVEVPMVDGLVDPIAVFVINICMLLLQRRLRDTLRFRFGETYGVGADCDWRSPPAEERMFRGDASVTFTCDPSAADMLKRLALDEFERLQEEACTPAELASLLTLEAQQWETSQEENTFWCRTLTNAYKSRSYYRSGDVDASIKRRDTARQQLRDSLTPEVLQRAFVDNFPHPVRRRYTAIALQPRPPLRVRLQRFIRHPATMVAGGALLAAGALCAFKWLRRRR